MKILILRMYPNKMNIKNYNIQEIGLAKALINKGNECDIVFSNENEENHIQEIPIDNNKKITIYWIKAKDLFSNAIYDEYLYDIVKQYDIIQTSEYDQIGNLLLYKKVGKPIVIYHGPYKSYSQMKDMIKSKIYDIFLKRKLIKYNPYILTKSELATEYLRRKGLKRITTVGVGLDCERFNNTKENISKEANGILEDIKNSKILLYIGQISKRRNITFLIETYKKVKEKTENTKLLIIGKGPQEYLNKCKKLINKYNLQNDIIIREKIDQDNIKFIYEKASIFLLPTVYEIFGMVLLEAMYFEIPIITTYNGGSSTIIENNKNGFIIPLNTDEWAKKAVELINDEEKRKEIIKNEKLSINKYTWDNLADKFIEVYKKAIEGRKRENTDVEY